MYRILHILFLLQATQLLRARYRLIAGREAIAAAGSISSSHHFFQARQLSPGNVLPLELLTASHPPFNVSRE
jgi:hypothetical protein